MLEIKSAVEYGYPNMLLISYPGKVAIEILKELIPPSRRLFTQKEVRGKIHKRILLNRSDMATIVLAGLVFVKEVLLQDTTISVAELGTLRVDLETYESILRLVEKHHHREANPVESILYLNLPRVSETRFARIGGLDFNGGTYFTGNNAGMSLKLALNYLTLHNLPVLIDHSLGKMAVFEESSRRTMVWENRFIREIGQNLLPQIANAPEAVIPGSPSYFCHLFDGENYLVGEQVGDLGGGVIWYSWRKATETEIATQNFLVLQSSDQHVVSAIRSTLLQDITIMGYDGLLLSSKSNTQLLELKRCGISSQEAARELPEKYEAYLKWSTLGYANRAVLEKMNYDNTRCLQGYYKYGLMHPSVCFKADTTSIPLPGSLLPAAVLVDQEMLGWFPPYLTSLPPHLVTIEEQYATKYVDRGFTPPLLHWNSPLMQIVYEIASRLYHIQASPLSIRGKILLAYATVLFEEANNPPDGSFPRLGNDNISLPDVYRAAINNPVMQQLRDDPTIQKFLANALPISPDYTFALLFGSSCWLTELAVDIYPKQQEAEATYSLNAGRRSVATIVGRCTTPFPTYEIMGSHHLIFPQFPPTLEDFQRGAILLHSFRSSITSTVLRWIGMSSSTEDSVWPPPFKITPKELRFRAALETKEIQERMGISEEIPSVDAVSILLHDPALFENQAVGEDVSVALRKLGVEHTNWVIGLQQYLGIITVSTETDKLLEDILLGNLTVGRQGLLQ